MPDSIDPMIVEGRVEAVLFSPTTTDKLRLFVDHGVHGDSHAGSTRLADVREKALIGHGFVKGIEIANMRQVSVVSREEINEIAIAMGIPGGGMPPGLLGENLIVEGIPNFTMLPPGTLLLFRDAKGIRTAAIAVWAENVPCEKPGEAIQAHLNGIPGIGRRFPAAAIHRRGIVGSVYCSGIIKAGDIVTAAIPQQRLYRP